MKKINTVILLFLLCNVLYSATYYVSYSTGNNANDGTIESLPWKTMSKINNSSFLPGDIILFKRGDTWREPMVISSSGHYLNGFIEYSSYSEGNLPKINLSTPVRGPASAWTLTGNNIWSRSLVSSTSIANFDILHLGVWTTSPNAKYEYYCNKTNKILYLYSEGNPYDYYDSIYVAKFNKPVIDLNGKHHVIIEDFDVLYGDVVSHTASPQGGIWMDDSSHDIMIKNNVIHHCYGGGIKIFGSRHIDISNNIIRKICSLNDGQNGDGIIVRHDGDHTNPIVPYNIVIKNNDIRYDIIRQGIAVVCGDKIQISSNSVESGNIGIDIEPIPGYPNKVTNVKINNNTIDISESKNSYGISVFDPQGDDISITDNSINLHDKAVSTGINVRGAINVNIYRNKIYNCRKGMRILYNAEVDIKNNFIKGGTDGSCGMQIIYGSVVTVAYNIISGQYQYSMNIGHDNTAIELYNNTIYGYKKYGLWSGSADIQIIAKNNIFHSTITGIKHIRIGNTANIILNNNCYNQDGSYFAWGTITYNLSQLKTNTGQELNGFIADPLFIITNPSNDIDFDIQNTSPCINEGVGVGLNDDYLQNPIIGNPDIGAFEYQ